MLVETAAQKKAAHDAKLVKDATTHHVTPVKPKAATNWYKVQQPDIYQVCEMAAVCAYYCGGDDDGYCKPRRQE